MRAPLDLNSDITRPLRMREYHLEEANVGVDMELGTDLPSVTGDARQLQQVCLNLVTNAEQAMSPLGGGRLRVRTYVSGDKVVLDVSDTGPGIPPEARAHIFEPFFTTKKEGEGTGLGLSARYGTTTARGGTSGGVHTAP